MAQREVTGTDNTKWTCVQAFSGSGNEELAEKAKERNGTGKVDVVCTPSGGAQSVRLQLEDDWEQLSDEVLVKQIEAGLSQK
ncbi:hypothetical protein [Aridibaculum aurantiacum]|uniref:hypothetical protein n=1 Tax=Aridibaculum aurantiacum TaxID=2810307 RepID=UPI001A963CEB|nr:hypothetical protein [Aridibaculum aurantiacum]